MMIKAEDREIARWKLKGLFLAWKNSKRQGRIDDSLFHAQGHLLFLQRALHIFERDELTPRYRAMRMKDLQTWRENLLQRMEGQVAGGNLREMHQALKPKRALAKKATLAWRPLPGFTDQCGTE